MRLLKGRIAYLILLAIFMLLNIFSNNVILAGTIGDSSKVDVVFVIDSSKSMIKSDPEKLSNEAMKMFIDMCHAQGDKGGMVAYSGGVIKQYALKNLNSELDKKALKDTLTGIKLGDWTDIGFGLKSAVSIMKEGHNKDNKPIIILLSDGKNDPDRNAKASIDDLSAALNEAKAQNFPIYTIGLNADGTVDKDQLEQISRETNGKNFITNTASELPSILREIFADNSMLKVLQHDTITGNGEFQDITINIPDSNVVEANISILSSKPVELKLADTRGNQVEIPSQNVIYTTSNKYSMIKLISPEKGKWMLRIKGSKADLIDISLISNYDLKVILDLKPEAQIHKGEKVVISSYIESNGQKLEDKDFYASLKATLYIKNLNDGQAKETQMSYGNNMYSADFTLPDDSSYQLIAKIEGPGFIRESDSKIIGAENRVPIKTRELKGITLWTKKNKVINLSDYFKDDDNDKLTYTVSTDTMDILNIKVNGNTLEIQARKWGEDTITITADDGKGGKVSSQLKVKVFFIFYILIIIIVLLIIIPAAILFIKRIKTSSVVPVGQVMIQVREETTGAVKSPQYKVLNHFKGTFTVHSLLNLSPGYAETAKILVKAGEGDTLVITNKSQCLIESYGRKVDASKGITMRNNDKLNIILTAKKEVISLQYFNR